MIYARESYSEALVQEMLPLWNAHYEEIALYKEIPLSPNLKVYAISEITGNLRVYTVRKEKVLVGYEVFFVQPHPHYSTALSAVQDILFLSQEIRQGLRGYEFIKWVDEQLRADGVNLVFQHVKVTHNYGPLLVRLGYIEHDIIYSRRLS